MQNTEEIRIKKIDGLVNGNTKYKWIKDIRYFIISGGKTGSTTLHSSFKRSIHIHSKEELYTIYPVFKELNIEPIDLIKYNYHINKIKPWVITAYREPISRAISSFFEHYDKYIPGGLDSNLNLNDIISIFNDIYMEHLETYDPLLMKDCVGDIDSIYQKPFNHQEGYQVYDLPLYRLLLLKFDKIKLWPNIINKVMPPDDLKNFSYCSRNISSSKKYHSLYTLFKNNFYTTRHLVSFRFNSFTYHNSYINTPSELNDIKNYWYSRCPVTDYKYVRIPDNFQWSKYVSNYYDLQINNINTEIKAKQHWILFGNSESRKYT